MAITITDQEKSLLNLIAKGESSAGVDPYTSLWPGTSEASLIQMTCSEVQRFQTQRITQGFKSTACGRYQFIKKTLTEAIKVSGIDPLTTCYTPDVQDYLILSILKQYRKLDQWIAGTYTTDKFMIKLSQEFASMPVPYQMKGQKGRIVNKGQSYYAGDGLNKAHHDPDSLFQQLNDILNGGTGETTTVDILPTGPSGAQPELGNSAKTQVARSTAGTGVGAVSGQGRPGSQPIGSASLPDVYNQSGAGVTGQSSAGPGSSTIATGRNRLPGGNAVYTYEVLDPLDDRYDFRTGKKVKDILVHGINAAAASPHVEQDIGAAGVAGTNTGTVPPGTTIPPVDETDPDAADPRGKTQIPSEAEQTQALEGNAPVAPAAAPTETPCPAPVSAANAASNASSGAANAASNASSGAAQVASIASSGAAAAAASSSSGAAAASKAWSSLDKGPI
jgi:muramidase (phage lysozyme)